MLQYLIRRILYMIPIILGVLFLTFFLFNVVFTPRQMALRILGEKASPQAVADWLHAREFDKPAFLNLEPGKPFWDSRFVHTVRRFAVFDLGRSFANDEPILDRILRDGRASLAITFPAFLLGFALSLSLSLLLVFVRESRIDRLGALLCIASMSLPITVYVILVQWVGAKLLPLFPAFGFNWDGLGTLRFLALPVLVMVFSGIGADVRLYRAIFLEEIQADYIRTAHAKGATNARVLFVHVLKNGLIAIITLVVASLPFLIMGTLVAENFFGIPGLGNMMVEAIRNADFAIIQADVFIGACLYLVGLLITDLCYAWADPRIRLQ